MYSRLEGPGQRGRIVRGKLLLPAPCQSAVLGPRDSRWGDEAGYLGSRSCKLREESPSLSLTPAPTQEASLPVMPMGLGYLGNQNETGLWRTLIIDREMGPERG